MATNGVKGYAGIEREIIELILQRKFFYGHFLQQFMRHNVDHKTVAQGTGKIIKTLAVCITNDLKPSLFVNTWFYNSGNYDPDNPNRHTWGLTQEEKIAVLEHEILHMLNKHLIRIENRNSYVWNLATDLAINQHIKGLPIGARCPECGVFVRKLPTGTIPQHCPHCQFELKPDLHKCEPLQIDRFEVQGQKINFEKNVPSETYYDILWKKLPKQVVMIGSGITDQREQNAKEQMRGEGQGGQGEGEEGEGTPTVGVGEGQGSQSGQQSGQAGQGKDEGEDKKDQAGAGIVKINGVEVPMVFDQHEAWATGADNKEMAHHKVKDMVQKALHKVTQKSQGSLPAYVQGLIDAVLAHKTVNWKSELRKFIGYEEFACFVSSRKRLNRRFPIIQPGYVVQRKAHFLVAVDSSGSIGDDEFAMFFKEIDIMRSAKVAITYVECDADIQKVEVYKRKPKQIERIGYGGTDFRPVFKFAKERVWKRGDQEFRIRGNKKIDGIIYLTDGMGSYPSKKDIFCPVIWVMTPNHSCRWLTPDLGKKIVMDSDKLVRSDDDDW